MLKLLLKESLAYYKKSSFTVCYFIFGLFLTITQHAMTQQAVYLYIYTKHQSIAYACIYILDWKSNSWFIFDQIIVSVPGYQERQLILEDLW